MTGMATELRISQVLHDENETTNIVLRDLESVLAGQRPSQAPEISDSAIRGPLTRLVKMIEGGLEEHFSFEENELFPLLTKGGESEMCRELTEEHEILLPLAKRVAVLAREGLDGNFSVDGWREFYQSGLDFEKRLGAHFQKEEAALLPAADELIEPEQNAVLVSRYAKGGPEDT